MTNSRRHSRELGDARYRYDRWKLGSAAELGQSPCARNPKDVQECSEKRGAGNGGIGRRTDQQPHPTNSSAGFDGLFRSSLYFVGPSLVPASTAVPTAAAQQQDDNHDDEECGDIHAWLPGVLVNAIARLAALQLQLNARSVPSVPEKRPDLP
jgi:hypothetical protein